VHSTTLAASSITFSVTGKPGATATITSVDQSLDTSTVDYHITWSGTPVVTNDTIVATVVTNRIYDVAGNATAGGATGSGTAKKIGMLGVLQNAGRAARGATALVKAVSVWIQSSILGDQSVSPHSPLSVGPALTEPASTLPAAPVRRTQFDEPMPTAHGPASQSTHRAADADQERTDTLQSVMPRAAAVPSMRSQGTTQGLPAVTSPQASVLDIPSAPKGSGMLPPWWILGLGILAAGSVTAGAWLALRFVRGRPGR